MSATPFTASQLQAIDPGRRQLDACVVAGPGSGKTTVLVAYFQNLVASGTDPLRILAITFTEKAASNMRKKLADAFHGDPEIRARLERAWVSTVHGFCSRLLRENSIFAGVNPEFYVADERESWRLQQESVAAAVAAIFDERPTDMRALIRGLSSPDFEESLLSAYDAMRSAGMTLEDIAAVPAPAGVTRGEVAETLRALCGDPLTGWDPKQRLHMAAIRDGAERIVSASGPLEALEAIGAYTGNLQKCRKHTAAYGLVHRLRDLLKELPYSLVTELYWRERALLFDVLRRFDCIYRERKLAAGALDFADLEHYAVRLLEENPQTRSRLQAQFDHILMDEFQDTNGQQARLLQLIRRTDRFYAVGDINQSIFGFRHAEPGVFRDYRDTVEQTGRRLVELTDNFRSRPEILRAVETIAASANGIEPRPLIARRQFEDVRPVCVDVFCAPTLDQEARAVARRILELRIPEHNMAEPSFAFRDIAVLVRNTEVLPVFSAAFEEAGIPYAVSRGKGFYEAREVKDLVHLLRVIANPRDEISLAAVLRSPLVRASDEALLALKAHGENLGTALMRLGSEAGGDFGLGDFEKLIHFRDRLKEWRSQRESVSFDRLLAAAIDDCAYECDSGARGRTNIDKFLAQAREAAARMSLDRFVDQLDLMRRDNVRERDAPPEDAADAVNVMTVHSAKGLEFPVVFVAALHKGIDSSLPGVAFSRRYGLGARWRNLASGEEKDDLFQHAIREERKKRESDESDRLLYVSMTRAEQHLVLSFTRSGKKLAHWAQHICHSLHLDLEQARDESLTRTAPDGSEWKLRLAVAGTEDEAGPGAARHGVGGPEGQPHEWIARPLIADQQETNATVTAIAAFAKCPREYYLGHYLGFEGRMRSLEASDDLPAAEFGSMVHALLAGTAVPNADPKALVLVEVAHQSALGRRLARATRVEREFDFLMSVEGLVLRGQIDLWFEEGGELVIVDYKTDSVTGVEAHQRALDYTVQLRLYALAVERITGRHPDRAWLHFLRPNTAIEVDLTPSLLDAPEQMVRDYQQAQDRLDFPLREGDHCRRCPFFRDLCPAGGA
jgi:ATP-dependent exoDNAse (exonuclease V) beta subunit